MISIGDYVVFGGETAAMVLLDSVCRRIPGILQESAVQSESHERILLEEDQYTKPRDNTIPSELLSGNHRKIENWRRKSRIINTYRTRPDILNRIPVDKELLRTLDQYFAEKTCK